MPAGNLSNGRSLGDRSHGPVSGTKTLTVLAALPGNSRRSLTHRTLCTAKRLAAAFQLSRHDLIRERSPLCMHLLKCAAAMNLPNVSDVERHCSIAVGHRPQRLPSCTSLMVPPHRRLVPNNGIIRRGKFQVHWRDSMWLLLRQRTDVGFHRNEGIQHRHGARI